MLTLMCTLMSTLQIDEDIQLKFWLVQRLLWQQQTYSPDKKIVSEKKNTDYHWQHRKPSVQFQGVISHFFTHLTHTDKIKFHWSSRFTISPRVGHQLDKAGLMACEVWWVIYCYPEKNQTEATSVFTWYFKFFYSILPSDGFFRSRKDNSKSTFCDRKKRSSIWRATGLPPYSLGLFGFLYIFIDIIQDQK